MPSKNDGTASQRKNRFGGSAGSGGYAYQDEVTALVVIKILSKRPLAWAETECSRLPVRVSSETGFGGDDLAVELESGIRVEIQAKSSARKTSVLWKALIELATAIEDSDTVFGALVTNTSASTPVRVELKKDIIRIGQGRTDDLHEIGISFLEKLDKQGLKDAKTICSRLRIIVLDLDRGSTGRDLGVSMLQALSVRSNQTETAWTELVKMAQESTTNRGAIDSQEALVRLQQSGIRVRVSNDNLAVIQSEYLRRLINKTSSFVIAGLNADLHIADASIRLQASTKQAEESTNSLGEQIERYHEWHRLADTSRDNKKETDAIEVVRSNRAIVVFAGPGAGKTTLTRRLAYDLASEGHVIVRVDLGLLAERLDHRRESFSEALTALVADDSGLDPNQAALIVGSATWMLADGLDETGTMRVRIAEQLSAWSDARQDRRVVVTTRPIGHNQSWFPDWPHLELLPLTDEQVREYSRVILGECDDAGKNRSRQFLEDLKQSHTASIASRNPLLLGFLLALFSQGFSMAGTRFSLFERIVELMYSRRRESAQHEGELATSSLILDCLAWGVTNPEIRTVNEHCKSIGPRVLPDLLPHEAEDEVRRALKFWEQQGILERVAAGGRESLTFVHLLLRDFGVARHLATWNEEDLAGWLEDAIRRSELQEVVQLLGGTERMEFVVKSLLAKSEPDDPVCQMAVVAASVLVESSQPSPDLVREISDALVLRLTSPVPMVVEEAGDELRRLVLIAPQIIVPIVQPLQEHKQANTARVAIALSILASNDFVNLNALETHYPSASATSFESRGNSRIHIKSNELMRDLIDLGTRILIDAGRIEPVKTMYKSGNASLGTMATIGDLLTKELGAIEVLKMGAERWGDLSRLAGRAPMDAFETGVLKAIAHAACAEEISDKSVEVHPPFESLSRFLSAVGFWESTMEHWVPNEEWGGIVNSVIKGAAIAVGIDKEMLCREAKAGLNSPEKLFREEVIQEIEVELDWQKGMQASDPDELPLALSHPSPSIRMPAAYLIGSIDAPARSVAYQKALFTGNKYAISLIANNLSPMFGEDAPDIVIERLERELTRRCGLLINAIADLESQPDPKRLQGVLLKAISSKYPDVVSAAVKEICRHDWVREFEEEMRTAFHRWLSFEPPNSYDTLDEDPSRNLADALCTAKFANEDDLMTGVLSGKRDVHTVVDTPYVASTVALKNVDELLQRIESAELPPRLLKVLSKGHPEVCAERTEQLLDFLSSDDPSLRNAVIAIAQDGWMEKEIAEKSLRSALEDDDLKNRDAAVIALRKLKVE